MCRCVCEVALSSGYIIIEHGNCKVPDSMLHDTQLLLFWLSNSHCSNLSSCIMGTCQLHGEANSVAVLGLLCETSGFMHGLVSISKTWTSHVPGEFACIDPSA